MLPYLGKIPLTMMSETGEWETINRQSTQTKPNNVNKLSNNKELLPVTVVGNSDKSSRSLNTSVKQLNTIYFFYRNCRFSSCLEKSLLFCCNKFHLYIYLSYKIAHRVQ